MILYGSGLRYNLSGKSQNLIEKEKFYFVKKQLATAFTLFQTHHVNLHSTVELHEKEFIQLFFSASFSLCNTVFDIFLIMLFHFSRRPNLQLWPPLPGGAAAAAATAGVAAPAAAGLQKTPSRTHPAHQWRGYEILGRYFLPLISEESNSSYRKKKMSQVHTTTRLTWKQVILCWLSLIWTSLPPGSPGSRSSCADCPHFEPHYHQAHLEAGHPVLVVPNLNLTTTRLTWKQVILCWLSPLWTSLPPGSPGSRSSCAGCP